MKKRLLFILPLLLAAAAGCASVQQKETLPAEAAETRTLSAPAEETETGADRIIDLSGSGEMPSGIEWSDGVCVVESAGTYIVSGRSASGLRVDADGPVELILDGVVIQAAEALRIDSKDPVKIMAAAGSENILTDGSGEPAGSEEAAGSGEAEDSPAAVILSKAPLTIGGGGAITVIAGTNNAIRAKSLLTIEGSILTVDAANNALKADDSVTITGGKIDIRSGGDGIEAEAGRLFGGDITISDGEVTISASGRGIHAEGTASVTDGTLSVDTEDDAVKAPAVSIGGGNVSLHTSADGIQAEQTLQISGGEIDVNAGEDGLHAADISVLGGSVSVESVADGIQGDESVSLEGGTVYVKTGIGSGGAINKSGDDFGPMMWSRTSETESDVSAKGIKSDDSITISGGEITLDTEDDAVHAAVLCTIRGGVITIASGDDALHSDDMLVIDDGTIRIDDCFEGLEAFAVEVNGGDIVIRAVNDGINANGSEFGMMGWGPWGRDAEEEEQEITSLSGEATTYFRQTGGTIDLVVTGTTRNCGDGIDSNGYVYIDGGVLTISTFGNTQEGGIDTGRDGPIVTGGMVMAGGASMMQESWASESTQCCAVISTDLQPDGTPVTIYDEAGNVIWSVTLADTFNCIVLSHPDLLPGHVYTVDYGGGTETLDFTSSTILRVGTSSFGWGFPGFR